MSLHDELKLGEGSHVILAAFLCDNADLLHDVSSYRIEASRVYTHGSIVLPIAVSDT